MGKSIFPKPFETDLLLIFPPFQHPIVSMENVGIEYIAAYARSQKYDVRIINSGLHGLRATYINRIIGQSKFKVLAISTLHWTIMEGLRIAKAAKCNHPDCHIIMGGIEASFSAEMILNNHPYIDSIGIGEGETIVSELLSCITKGLDWRSIDGLVYRNSDTIVFNKNRQLIHPLDSLPFPARDDISAVLDSGGPVCISSSRGCFGRCSFCSVRAFYDLSDGQCWRGRSPNSVVTEICQLYEDYGVRLFSFIDETVVGPGINGISRLREIANLILESGIKINFFMTLRAEQVETKLFRELKFAGLRKVEIGIESMAESQLQRYKKIARAIDNQRALRILENLGISSEVFMIPYDPYITYDELEQTLSFYEHRFTLRPKCYDIAPLTMGDYLYPYPGTDAKRLYKKLGCLGSNFYVPFRAEDKTITMVYQAVQSFIAMVDSALPMSFTGLGNLWVNGNVLPYSVYLRLCEICSLMGVLLLDFTRWAYQFFSKHKTNSIIQVESISIDLDLFFVRAKLLREEIKNILRLHSGFNKPSTVPPHSLNTFARQLYLFGRRRRKSIVEKMYQSPVNEKEQVFTFIKQLKAIGSYDRES